MMNDYYVYVFFRETGIPFYVGKGRGHRWKVHFRDAQNKKLGYHHLNIIRDMLNRGIDVPVVKLHQWLTNKQAIEYEIALIAAIGRQRDGGLLANITTGGEGFIGLPPESRAKQAAAIRGRKASPETKAKMSATRLGRGFSLERNKKVSLAKLGKKFTLEARANMSAAKKLQAKKGLIIANLGTRMLGRKHSPETREKMRIASLGRKMSSEARAKANGLDAPPYHGKRVRSDALRIASLECESALVHMFEPCPVAHLTNMRMWAYKTGLIKPKPKPVRPVLVTAPLAQATLNQLKREAAIAAGEPVPELKLDQATKGKIDDEVKAIAEQTGLVDKERRSFETILRAELRKIVQEGRAYKERCDIEARQRIEQEVDRRLSVALPNRQRELDEATRVRKHYEELIGNHKPIFTIEEFRTILKALHPDTATKETAGAAFHVFETRKFRLTGVR